METIECFKMLTVRITVEEKVADIVIRFFKKMEQGSLRRHEGREYTACVEELTFDRKGYLLCCSRKREGKAGRCRFICKYLAER